MYLPGKTPSAPSVKKLRSGSSMGVGLPGRTSHPSSPLRTLRRSGWHGGRPKWCDTSEWPFVQEDAGDGDWGDLADGGKDGLFLAVVSLGWWVLAQDAPKDLKVNEAIEDVTWVIKNLVSLLSTSATISSTPPAVMQNKCTRWTMVNPWPKLTKCRPA